MASKQPRTATRASARAKTQAATTQAPARLTRAASKVKDPEPAPKPAAKNRKPFVSRENSPEMKPSSQKNSQRAPLSKANSVLTIPEDNEREPIKAFLRIRPHLGEDVPSATPYLEPISDTSVRMLDPSLSSQSYSRLSSVNSSSLYTFSHVFPPSTQQQDFFQKTTLPFVKDVLEGQSGLLFAYGVTNSGKTYTIQGGSEAGSAGILPRTLDVIFNSIDGLHGDGRYRPIRLQGVELSTDEPSSPVAASRRVGPALADILEDTTSFDTDIDPTTIKLDRNYEYTIWLSYAEVYNEKVYDLLASVDDPSASEVKTGIPRPTSTFLNMPLPSSQSHPLLLTRKALPVKPCPPSDTDSSSDMNSSGKYVAGLRQIRVKSAAEAKALLKLGQLHRTVFGTLANSQSSRSHAFVTIKVLRVHRGERNDPTSIQTSRLTLVDLAGSERTKHTHTTGDRLKEAGNINKSLMVLGQCMETMRANQRTLARSLGTHVGSGGKMDTRDVKKGLAVVPFRHSKLTEILMDYFVGEGRVAMIVNVNPYDTGYDENSHVMKFAALAREVSTTAPTAVHRPLPSGPKSKENKVAPKASPSRVPSSSYRRKVTISMGGPGRKASETHLEVLEEDEEPGDGDSNEDDNEPINPLVDALFDEIENLRMQLFESEMRCAIIEAETREEVMLEMEERMREMEKRYAKRLIKEVERNEIRMDAKIDMLHRSKACTPNQAGSTDDEIDEEEDEVETSLGDDSVEQGDDVEDGDTWDSELSRSPSPLAGKGQQKHPKLSMLQPAASETDEEDITMENSDDDQEGQTALFGQHSDIEEWNSQEENARKRPTPKKSRLTPMQLISPPPPIFEADVKAAQQNARKVKKVSSSLGGLEDELDVLSLAPSGEKKKKRQTDRKPNLASRESGGAEEKQLRRSTRARS